MAESSRFYKVQLRTAQDGEFEAIIPACREEDIYSSYDSENLKVVCVKYLDFYKVDLNLDFEPNVVFSIILDNEILVEWKPNSLGYQYLEFVFRPQINKLWNDYHSLMYPNGGAE